MNTYPTRVNWIVGAANRIFVVALEILAFEISSRDGVFDHVTAFIRVEGKANITV